MTGSWVDPWSDSRENSKMHQAASYVVDYGVTLDAVGSDCGEALCEAAEDSGSFVECAVNCTLESLLERMWNGLWVPCSKFCSIL